MTRSSSCVERGALQQVGIYEDEPFESYFSGNTVQICPVGALTGAAYRFRSRPFDLVSSPSVCEHCACGCATRTDHRRGKVLRRMAGDDPAVNEEWNCDKGRWAFTYATGARPASPTPMVRDGDGELRAASWPEALDVAAARPGRRARRRGRRRAGRRPGDRRGRLRLRASSRGSRSAPTTSTSAPARTRAEEADFLAATSSAGPGPTAERSPTPTSRARPAVLLVGLRARGGVADRLPAAAQGGPRHRAARSSPSPPYATRGLDKLGGTLLAAAPGTEAEVLAALGADGRRAIAPTRSRALRARARSSSSASGWPRRPAR